MIDCVFRGLIVAGLIVLTLMGLGLAGCELTIPVFTGKTL